MFQAHFWESYSHGKPNRDSPATEQSFIDRVIRHLQGQEVTNPAPSTYKPYIAPTGPGIDASLFNAEDDETKLFIMTPVADGQSAGSKTIKYRTRVPAIQSAIRRILGKRPAFVQYGYLRYSSEEIEAGLQNTENRGMALFQYDPNSDGNGQRAWRLFYEAAFYSEKLG